MSAVESYFSVLSNLEVGGCLVKQINDPLGVCVCVCVIPLHIHVYIHVHVAVRDFRPHPLILHVHIYCTYMPYCVANEMLGTNLLVDLKIGYTNNELQLLMLSERV